MMIGRILVLSESYEKDFVLQNVSFGIYIANVYPLNIYRKCLFNVLCYLIDCVF